MDCALELLVLHCSQWLAGQFCMQKLIGCMLFSHQPMNSTRNCPVLHGRQWAID